MTKSNKKHKKKTNENIFSSLNVQKMKNQKIFFFFSTANTHFIFNSDNIDNNTIKRKLNKTKKKKKKEKSYVKYIMVYMYNL